MTILPKKKTAKEKNDGDPADHSHHGRSAKPDWPTSDSRVAFARNSPPPTRWVNHGHAPREEPRTSHEPNTSYNDLNGLENTQFGPNKRVRHKHDRASPHRHGRKHRHERHDRERQDGRASGQHSPKSGPSSPNHSGYNSGDEHVTPPTGVPENVSNIDDWERIFEETLKKKRGWILKKMDEDGACLFRSIADQVYGDQEMHSVVRKHCMDYICKNRDFFSQYITEDFLTYINRKRLDHTHGNHLEIQALSEMYNRNIEVYQYSCEPINVFHGMHTTDNEPIRVSYHRGVHYNSVVDPHKATIGVGLGLPGYKPGAADKNLMKDALQKSEVFHIEQTMLQDKMKATDWEATNEAIEEQVARESYLQWLRDQEKRGLQHTETRTSNSATCSSATISTPPPTAALGCKPPSPLTKPEVTEAIETRDSGAGHSSNDSQENGDCDFSCQSMEGACGGDVTPHASGSSSSVQIMETASIMRQLPATVFGFSDWEDEHILAQVLAASQEEYLQSLKSRPHDGAGPSSRS